MMWRNVIVASIGLSAPLAGHSEIAAEPAGQGLRVFSEPEAHCTLACDGKIISDLDIGKKYDAHLGLGVASLDYSSHHDVVVTCTHKGFQDGFRTLTFGKMFMSIAAQPCYPPTDATDAERKVACKDWQATHEGRDGGEYFGYPPNIAIPLVRTN